MSTIKPKPASYFLSHSVWFASADHPNLEFKNLTFLGQKKVSATGDVWL